MTDQTTTADVRELAREILTGLLRLAIEEAAFDADNVIEAYDHELSSRAAAYVASVEAALAAKGIGLVGPGQIAVPVDQAKALAAMLHDNGYHAESDELCANIAALDAGAGPDREGTA